MDRDDRGQPSELIQAVCAAYQLTDLPPQSSSTTESLFGLRFDVAGRHFKG